MAKKRRKYKRKQAKRNEEYPGWVWMVFGLTIGLSVAFAIYVNGLSRTVAPQQTVRAEQSTNTQATDTSQQDSTPVPEDAPPRRFDFYSMLPNFEVVVPEQESDVTQDTQPQAVVQPGNYVLQAGSFSRFEDADRRRAELALQGIESRVQRVSIDDKTYHRVRIGPLNDLNQLNMIRSRLRQANIDVLRIRVGD
jgi:cell division protein FtsN